MSWTNRQKGIMQMYRRYAGLSTAEYGEILYGVSGQRSSTAGELGQYQYDRAMALFETRAHLAEVNGCAVGVRPGKITDWWHWRNRCPSLGGVTSRQLHKIREWWEICCKWLEEDSRTGAYLLGVAARACGQDLESLDDLSEAQARFTIEGLKSMQRRLVREANRTASDRVAAKYHATRPAAIEEEESVPARAVQTTSTRDARVLQWGQVGADKTEAKAG